MSYHWVDTIAEEYEKDKLLVTAILHGDQGAFAEIICRSESMVTSILCNMIKIEEDRKDIAQEVYLKAYKYLAGFKHQSKLTTWICQIAYNTCLNHLAKKQFLSIEELKSSKNFNFSGDDEVQPPQATVSWTESDIFNQDLRLILQREISKLTPLHQTLIGLFHQEEMSYNEIARITQLPEGTVKSYLFRARKTLKENILLNYKQEDL